MDPNYCFKLLMAAMLTNQWSEASVYAMAMTEWLGKGGFPPEDERAEDVIAICRAAILQADKRDASADPIWKADDIGYYADGTFGHRHIRHKLSYMIVDLDPALSKLLLQDPSDDMSEEDDALALLNKHTVDSAQWIIDGGDLVLTDCESELHDELA